MRSTVRALFLVPIRLIRPSVMQSVTADNIGQVQLLSRSDNIRDTFSPAVKLNLQCKQRTSANCLILFKQSTKLSRCQKKEIRKSSGCLNRRCDLSISKRSATKGRPWQYLNKHKNKPNTQKIPNTLRSYVNFPMPSPRYT